MQQPSSRGGRARSRAVGCALTLASLPPLACAAGPALAGAIAWQDPRLAAPGTLGVSIAGVTPGGALPANYTADGRNLSPPVTWTAGPPGTRAYVVVMQDPDAPGEEAALHWLAYDVPPRLTALPRGMKNEAAPKSPLGVLQGPDFHGSMGYSGPRPPEGDPPHHYHLQVFAVDAPVRVRAGAELRAVERAMAGHVIARGELVATYAALPPKSLQPRAAQPRAAAPPPPAPAAPG